MRHMLVTLISLQLTVAMAVFWLIHYIYDLPLAEYHIYLLLMSTVGFAGAFIMSCVEIAQALGYVFESE